MFESSPGENTPARQRTTVTALYTNEFLYLGFRCYDSVPENIRAHLCDRDQIFRDDFVLATIDPYNNFQKGYEFAVNPFGIQGDLLLTSTNEDESFDMAWQSAGAINEEGWTAEMAIPFKCFSFSANENQAWTVMFIRNYPRDNRYRFSWVKYDRNNPSYMSQGGLLIGLNGIKPGHSFDLLPYVMAEQAGSRTDVADQNSEFKNDPWKVRVGGGIHYSPGPQVSIDAVINPDFSQIESDADQISVNTTFALYYPEKRPFFMAGTDLLETPMYYSRTINNPLAATRINGKSGKISYQALAAYDRNTPVMVPGEEESNTVQTDLGSYATVGRVRYDPGNENFLGGLVLSRNLTDAHNYLAGFDWNYKFWKNWYWTGELFMSQTKELNDTTLLNNKRQFGSTGHDAAFNGEQYFGNGIHLTLMRRARNYSFSLTHNAFSPTFQSYNGIYSNTGLRGLNIQHSYSFYPNKKLIQKASIFISSALNYNYDWVFKEVTLIPGINVTALRQTQIAANYLLVNTESFHGVVFRNVRRSSATVISNPLGWLNIQLQGSIGRFIYRSQQPDIGKGYQLAATIGLEPVPRLKSNFTCTLAKLNSLEDGREFYNGYILRNMTSFQFTKRLFLRAIFQYNSFGNSFNVYPLISYKINAFTMACAGMTQDIITYGEEDYTFKPTAHQYFIKLQYLFSK
jgi:hypothetical protein